MTAEQPVMHDPDGATRAILWDIDGTLLRVAGTGTIAFTAALKTVTGLDFPVTALDMGGQTDQAIAALILDSVGHTDPAAQPAMIAAMIAEVELVYETREVEFSAITEIKPGIVAALDALASIGAVQTIVTGNVESVARRKVRGAGLEAHLRFELGGYGSDHHLRAELVRLARSRLAAAGHDIDPRHTWVIGDTHRDFECARDAGVRCILVATGNVSYDELADLGADAVLHDLSDVAELVSIVTAD